MLPWLALRPMNCGEPVTDESNLNQRADEKGARTVCAVKNQLNAFEMPKNAKGRIASGFVYPYVYHCHPKAMNRKKTVRMGSATLAFRCSTGVKVLPERGRLAPSSNFMKLAVAHHSPTIGIGSMRTLSQCPGILPIDTAMLTRATTPAPHTEVTRLGRVYPVWCSSRVSGRKRCSARMSRGVSIGYRWC